MTSGVRQASFDLFDVLFGARNYFFHALPVLVEPILLTAHGCLLVYEPGESIKNVWLWRKLNYKDEERSSCVTRTLPDSITSLSNSMQGSAWLTSRCDGVVRRGGSSALGSL